MQEQTHRGVGEAYFGVEPAGLHYERENGFTSKKMQVRAAIVYVKSAEPSEIQITTFTK